ncbi:MAG: hypothetical protein WBF12_08700, partial [Bradyrhizobium sp.]
DDEIARLQNGHQQKPLGRCQRSCGNHATTISNRGNLVIAANNCGRGGPKGRILQQGHSMFRKQTD